ncbi:hypothetical protein DBR11_16345, partial [Pedobacter sp. HMWF019]|uniref:hypothetical protein n=1 Tax=Pedobacter sp. HMWF019 TaxID=2056856 RepID=UPI000D422FD3
DYKISYLAEKKFVIYPFISTQKEFGYSDVTTQNNIVGRVTKIFDDVIEKFSQLDQVSSFYNTISND